MEKIKYETSQECAFILGHLAVKPLYNKHYIQSNEFFFYLKDLQDYEEFGKLMSDLKIFRELLLKRRIEQ